MNELNTAKLIGIFCNASTNLWRASRIADYAAAALAEHNDDYLFLSGEMEIVRDLYRALPERVKDDAVEASIDRLYPHLLTDRDIEDRAERLRHTLDNAAVLISDIFDWAHALHKECLDAQTKFDLIC